LQKSPSGITTRLNKENLIQKLKGKVQIKIGNKITTNRSGQMVAIIFLEESTDKQSNGRLFQLMIVLKIIPSKQNKRQS